MAAANGHEAARLEAEAQRRLSIARKREDRITVRGDELAEQARRALRGAR
jgi:hypothetical protein